MQVTVKELAAMTGTSAWVVRRKIKDGEIKALNFGKRMTRIDLRQEALLPFLPDKTRAQVEAMMAEREAE